MRDVVSHFPHFLVAQHSQGVLALFFPRHASIDAATRAARGLPEDLIRLCVGIEDPTDLLDDLERALIDAGALVFNVSQNKYVRTPLETDAISRAVEKLALGVEKDQREWFISAPGKVILFGEHAVVHGVVSLLAPLFMILLGGSRGLYLLPRLSDSSSTFIVAVLSSYTDRNRRLSRPPVLWSYNSQARRQAVGALYGHRQLLPRMGY